MSSAVVRLGRWRRLADYLTAVAMFLRGNFMLEEPLQPSHVRFEPVGRWDKVPAFNAAYAHLRRLSAELEKPLELYTTLPQAWVPLLVNWWLDGTLSADFPHTRASLEHLLRDVETLANRAAANQGTPSAVAGCLTACVQDNEDCLDIQLLVTPRKSVTLADETHLRGVTVLVVEGGPRFESLLMEALRDAASNPSPPLLALRLSPTLGLPADLAGFPRVASDADTLARVEQWLRGYHVEKILHPDGRPSADILSLT